MAKYIFEGFDPKGRQNWKARFKHLVRMLNGDTTANPSAAGKAAHWLEDYTGLELDRKKLRLPDRRK
jgi:hypothetical protein